MKALLTAFVLLCATLPVLARAPNSGAEYFRHQQERNSQPMDSSSWPVRAPWYED